MSVKAPAAAVRVSWANIAGKPATFAPSAHTHAYSSLTGIPATFAPSAHTHPISDVTGLQTALDGKQTSGSYITTANFTWANLSGKPTMFPPSAHTHSYNDLTDKPTILTSGRLELIGTLNFSETALVSIALGMKRRTVALAGVLATDRLVFTPTAAPTVGCEVINVYPASAGNVSVGYYTPLLGIGASYSMPIAVFRVTT